VARRGALVPADETDTDDLSDEATKKLVLAVTFINGLITNSNISCVYLSLNKSDSKEV